MNNLGMLALLAFGFAILPEIPVMGYPAAEMRACVHNATNAVATKGLNATYKQVLDYCDCSLTAIIDRGQDMNQSLARCNVKAGFK